tara:strand:- start:62 stop:370 length:309 start_codon:yes stop_codon:yes gene_type:complete
MAKKSSTMSPKRLFILLCLAGLLMWMFSKTEVETEIIINSSKDKVEEIESANDKKEESILKEQVKLKEKKKARKSSSKKKQDNQDYLKKRELNYDPSTRNRK